MDHTENNVIKKPIQYDEQEYHPGQIISHSFDNNIFECKDENSCTLRLYVVSDFIIRVRYSVNGIFFRDFSYGLDQSYQATVGEVNIAKNHNEIIIETSEISVHVSRSDMKVTFKDKNGTVLNRDEKGFHWEHNPVHGGFIVQMTKHAFENESFYGLGDKTVDLNMKGHRFQNWGTDNYGYNKGSDPLYKSIPIYYGLNQNKAYGIFFDNTYDSYFDFGKERPEVTSFWSMGGEMNYYFIAGPQLMQVAERYTLLTGTPDMPPFWSLGFQQCKWSYYPESNVREITTKMRELNIPCDAIYLDIDYMDGFRCFTWDLEKFPDPKKMVSDLMEQGFKTMVIIDPGIKVDNNNDIFKEGLAKDYFCKHADGAYVQGKVWPGDCYFPDFTKPEVREWWASLYQSLIEDTGVAGVWNDMNEPALFEVPSKTFPLNVLHDYDGDLTSHRKAHNVYGMQMARATYEGVKQYSNGERSLIITRSGYSGLQRYSSVWTGDNIATWEHLWLADVQAQRLNISGISFCGSDIGGFIGQPTGELFVRWIALGIFHPFCRVHSSGDHGDQEPWTFGDKYTDLFRTFVELRYKLLPYIYTSFHQYCQNGTPMLRPIVFVDQEDSHTIDRDHEFLCGDHLLVCPVVVEGAKTRKVYLTKGAWYNYYTNNKYDGKQEIVVDTPIDQIPLFVQEGAILPLYPVQQYTGEKHIIEVSLNVYYKNGELTSQYYEDDHNTYAYENGQYLLSEFHLNGSDQKLEISQTNIGEYKGDISTYALSLIGLPFSINQIVIDDQVANVADLKNDKQQIEVPSNFRKISFSA